MNTSKSLHVSAVRILQVFTNAILPAFNNISDRLNGLGHFIVNIRGAILEFLPPVTILLAKRFPTRPQLLLVTFLSSLSHGSYF